MTKKLALIALLLSSAAVQAQPSPFPDGTRPDPSEPSRDVMMRACLSNPPMWIKNRTAEHAWCETAVNRQVEINRLAREHRDKMRAQDEAEIARRNTNRVNAQAKYDAATDGLPSCDDPKITELLSKVIVNSPYGKSVSIMVEQIGNARPVENPNIWAVTPRKECLAVAYTSAGRLEAVYELEWTDKANGKYWLQARW
jgi:hypothetical protein